MPRASRSHTPNGESDNEQLRPPMTRSKSGRATPAESQPQPPRATMVPKGARPQPRPVKKSVTASGESSPSDQPVQPRRRGRPPSVKSQVSPPSPVQEEQAFSSPLTALTSDPLPFGPSFPPGTGPSRKGRKRQGAIAPRPDDDRSGSPLASISEVRRVP